MHGPKQLSRFLPQRSLLFNVEWNQTKGEGVAARLRDVPEGVEWKQSYVSTLLPPFGTIPRCVTERSILNKSCLCYGSIVKVNSPNDEKFQFLKKVLLFAPLKSTKANIFAAAVAIIVVYFIYSTLFPSIRVSFPFPLSCFSAWSSGKISPEELWITDATFNYFFPLFIPCSLVDIRLYLFRPVLSLPARY